MSYPERGIRRNQGWLTLASILSASYTFPMLVSGPQIAAQYGVGAAICSILCGNLILWAVGLIVISMATENSSNAIENVRSYLGKYGAIFIWLILMVSILNWFVQQLDGVVPLIASYFGSNKESTVLRLGAGLGLFITLLSTGGIRLLKWITLISLPFVLCYHFYSFFQPNHSIGPIGALSLPASGVISIILILLPGILNLPTLFRHAKSKADAYLGLGVMMLFISF
jgi:purine-cytosine permease-like protein